MHSRRLWTELALELAAFSVLVASVVLLWGNNLLLFLAVLVECLVALSLCHERFDLSLFMVIALLGSLAEALFVHFGVWRYANPSFLGVPLWFPLAFGTTGLIGGRLARTITTIWERLFPSASSKVS